MKRIWLCAFVLLLSGVVRGQDIPRADDTIVFPEDATVYFSPDLSHILALRPEGDLVIFNRSAHQSLSASLDTRVYDPFITWNSDSSALLFIHRYDLFLVDSATAEVRLVYHAGDSEEVYNARFYQDRTIVARVATHLLPSSYHELETHVWDMESWEEILTLPPDDDCLTATPDEPFAAEIVDFMRVSGGFRASCGSFYWNPDHTRYLRWVFYNTGTLPIEVYDADGNKLYEIRQCAAFTGSEPGPDCELLAGTEAVRWSPDGTIIAALPTFFDAPLSLWDAGTGALLYELPPPGEATPLPVTGIHWSNDGRIASFGLGGVVYLWDATTGDLLFHWQDLDEPVTDCRFLYHDALLLCWTQYSPLSRVVGGIWDTHTGENLALITSDTAIIEGVAEDPLYGFLFINFGHYVEIWDLPSLAARWGVEPG